MTELSRDLDSKLDKDYSQMLFDVKYDKDQFKDPEFIGLLMYRLVKEREASNKMFKQIQKLLKENSVVTPSEKSVEILSEVDEKILSFVTRLGKADAEALQKEFNYKGKNAASARLNALYKSALKKGRAGKKVYYWV